MILGLLPVRNGGEELARWLEDARTWCDGVIALDDGSSDDTRAILEASSLVVELLTHPVRASAAGWDDGRNRRELLAAAAAHAPDWILWFDADERLAADDAAALRTFVAGDALPGVAYGFRHCRMWGPTDYDPRTPWVYRLFAWHREHTLAAEWLHFNPVPEQIPRHAWVRTSIRLQHFGAADEAGIHARARKYADADPDAIFPIDFGAMDRAPQVTVPWVDRTPDQPIVLGHDDAYGTAMTARDVSRAVAESDRPLVAALLPVRNGAADLEAWFRSVAPVADVIVALDDGSTDATRTLLADEPAVRRLLHRPTRPDHVGWDDALNRRVLLDAAAELSPRWILWLDADERVSPGDAAALREFLEGDADPTAAYGFRVHRMVGDDEHYDRNDLWVYRLFAWQPGMHFPAQRLHFVPIPAEIPRERWLRTSIRIQHFASVTRERRQARFQKYREADPDHEFQADYGDLLAEPGPRQRFLERTADEPVVLGPEHAVRHDDPAPPRDRVDQVDPVNPVDHLDFDAPVLSAIVISRDDRDRIAATVTSVIQQEMPEPFEVIVVVSGSDGTADVVRDTFPDVHLVDLGPGPALPGRARNAGLAVARGDFVSFPGSHITLPPGSLAARVRAHELGYPMVTGTMRNANHTPAGWASYFLDHSSVLPGSPSGEMTFAPPHCSYDRELLMQLGGFPEDLRAGEDTVVNTTLFRRGLRAWRATEVELSHASPCRTPADLVAHHFRRGRGLGRIMLNGIPPGGRAVNRNVVRQAGLDYVRRRTRSTRTNVGRFGDGELQREYDKVRLLVDTGVVAAWFGTWWELLRPAPGKLRALVGTPAVHVVIAGIDRRGRYAIGRTDALLLARIDVLHGRVALLAPPRDLLVDVDGAGPCRLNEVYTHGATSLGDDDPPLGMRALADALGGVFDVRIDGVVLADFDGFVRLVDALGGVEVDIDHPIHDEILEVDFEAGRQRLDGIQALTYAQTRQADGDRWRRDRHVQLVTAIGRAALGRGALHRGALSAARSSVIIDLSALRAIVGGLGAARALRRHAIKTVPLHPPAVRSVQLPDLGWVHVGDPAAIAREVRERFLSG